MEPFSQIHSFAELVHSGHFGKAAVRRVLRVLVMARSADAPRLVTVAVRNKQQEAEVALGPDGSVCIARVVAPHLLVADPLDELQCSTCGASCTATCSGCQVAAYCHAACQRADRGAHKAWCRAAQQLPEGTASHAFKTPRKLKELLGQHSSVEASMAGHLQRKSCRE